MSICLFQVMNNNSTTRVYLPFIYRRIKQKKLFRYLSHIFCQHRQCKGPGPMFHHIPGGAMYSRFPSCCLYFCLFQFLIKSRRTACIVTERSIYPTTFPFSSMMPFFTVGLFMKEEDSWPEEI